MPQGNPKRTSGKAGKGQLIKDWGTLEVLDGQDRAGAQWQGCPLTLGVSVEPLVLCSGRAPEGSRHLPSCNEGTSENPHIIPGGIV